MHYSRFLRFCLSFLMSAILLPVILGLGCAGEPMPAPKPTITLVENNWTSQIILTEIVEQVLSEQLGYPTERVKLACSANWAAMCKGEADIATEIWTPARRPEIQPFLDQGCLELAGEIFPGGGGWIVPRFVVEGDPARGIEPMAPDLKSILDLKKHWKLFESPEKPGKGELVGGSPGWVDDLQDRSMILGYELPLWRSNQTEAVMCARMIAANKKGEPLLMYMWWPHWIFSVVDLVKLEEPDPWHEGCFKTEEAIIEPVKCGHPIYHINKVVTAELKDKAPEVYHLMKKMVMSEEEINTLMLRVDVDEEEIAVVAADWISKNQNKINRWLGK